MDSSQYGVMVWFKGQPFHYDIAKNNMYEEFMEYIQLNIFDLPQKYYLVEMDDQCIPIRKVTSDQDLKAIIEKYKESMDLPQFTIISSDIECHDYKYGDTYDDSITKMIQKKELQGLFQDLATIKANVDDQIKMEVINFCVGITGSGKSTIANHWQGIQLQCKKVRSQFHIIPKFRGYGKVAEIGNGFLSCTSLPEYYRARNGEILCDLAGFIDTKGIKQQIRNSFSNSQVFKANSLIRIIIVLQKQAIMGQKGKHFVDTIKMIHRLFPQNQSIKKCSGIIVTKVSEDLKKQDIVSNISQIIDQNQYLIESEKQYMKYIVASERIAIFRVPKKIGENQYKIDFKEEEDIIKFISQIPDIKLEKDSEISLSPKAKLQIINIIKNIEDMIEEQAEKLILAYPSSNDYEPTTEQLGIYLKNIDEGKKKIKTQFPYDIDQLIEGCKIIGIKINFSEFERTIGSLIKNLRRCKDLIPNHEFRTDLFDCFLFCLHQRYQKFFLKMNNSFDRQEIAQIAHEHAQKQKQVAQQISMKQKQILERMRIKAQKNRDQLRAIRARYDYLMNQQNQQQEQQLRSIRGRRMW